MPVIRGMRQAQTHGEEKAERGGAVFQCLFLCLLCVPVPLWCICSKLRAAAPAVPRERRMAQRAPAAKAHARLLRVAAVLARGHREGDQDDHDDEEDEFHRHSRPWSATPHAAAVTVRLRTFYHRPRGAASGLSRIAAGRQLIRYAPNAPVAATARGPAGRSAVGHPPAPLRR